MLLPCGRGRGSPPAGHTHPLLFIIPLWVGHRGVALRPQATPTRCCSLFPCGQGTGAWLSECLLRPRTGVRYSSVGGGVALWPQSALTTPTQPFFERGHGSAVAGRPHHAHVALLATLYKGKLTFFRSICLVKHVTEF